MSEAQDITPTIDHTGKPGETVMVHISKLIHHPDNVRTIKGSVQAFDELKAGIKEVGLLQNLVSVPPNGAGMYAVFGGGRRLDALIELWNDGDLPNTHEVAVQIRDVSSVSLLSAIENEQREPLHWLDRFNAYARAVDAGVPIDEVIDASGKSSTYVKGLLKLSKLDPTLIEAYREGHTTLEVLQALTLTDDHDLQVSVFTNNEHSPWRIHQILTDEKISTNDVDAKLIDIEAYVARGGVVVENLFDTESYLVDVPLVQQMVGDALISVREALITEGWSDVRIERDRKRAEQYRERTGRQRPAKAELPPELAARLDAAEKHLEICHEAWMQDDATSHDSERNELAKDALSEIQAEVIETTTSYTDKQRSEGKALITVDPVSGRVVVERGFIERTTTTTPDNERSPDIPAAELKVEKGEGTPRPAISEKLMRSLTGHKHQRLQLEIMDNPEYAAVLGQFLTIERATQTGTNGTNFYNQVKEPEYRVRWEQPNTGKTRDAIKALERGLSDAIKESLKGTLGERWRKFQALQPAARAELHAFALGGLLVDPGHDDQLYNLVYRELETDLPTMWRPTADNFFRHVGTTEALLDYGEQIGGKEWRAGAEKLKKTVIAAQLEALCADPANTWLPKELKA